MIDALLGNMPPLPLNNDRTLSKKLTLRATRKIEYSIVHPQYAVFDIDTSDLKEMCDDRPAIFFMDHKIADRYLSTARAYAERHLRDAHFIVVECGETHKVWETAEDVLLAAVEANLPRHGVMVAVGGGCLLDVVGLAAALYRRGVAYVRIPTTLLGMIDVAVGIKHGVNHLEKKNLLGTFAPPLGAINDLYFLESLPARESACGFAEMLKIAAVADAQLFELLERYAARFPSAYASIDRVTLETLLVRAEAAMIAQLSENLFEDDMRRLADFGHTFSPLLETDSGASIAHGEAVGLDMILSASISLALGLCEERYTDRFIEACRATGLPLWHPLCETHRLARSVVMQRAHRGGTLNLVIPVEPGVAQFLQDVPDTLLEDALTIMRERTSPERFSA